MKEYDMIQGKVVGDNSLLWSGRLISCWENSMHAAVAPQPFDLSPYKGKIVEVRGRLHGDLWETHSLKIVQDEKYSEITGEVIGANVIQGPGGPVNCYRHGKKEAIFLPLNLREYMGQTITVGGELDDGELYYAYISKVPEISSEKDPDKEARSLNDLLRIRAANREKIEAVNGSLGTALGFKWTNNRETDHPCVIIFVPQKISLELIPDEEKAPEILEGPGGEWCFTDVVTGGKSPSIGAIGPLPRLSAENQFIVKELRSGRIGLIGGIQLAAFKDGIQDWDHSYFGTAGVKVQHTETGRVGFLTNQHVADAPGRRIYHPWPGMYPIGTTVSTIEYAYDEEWYKGTIDEQNSYVRCDCGFVKVDENLSSLVMPGLHAIGRTGPLLNVDPGTMDIIGQRVISVGRTRGVQRGTIAAYAYEFHDEIESIYTDLLIIGEDESAFSWKGDSGKIIVTDDEQHRPVALLWGGWEERLRHGREQEVWSYAIDLGKVLKRMNLRLVE